MPSGYPCPVEVRDRFFGLVCSGTSMSAACRALGLSRQTGHRWWSDAGGAALAFGANAAGVADRPDPSFRPERALSGVDRGAIQYGLRRGDSYARIGAAIGRDKSVVWHEVQRNKGPDGLYNADLAQVRAHANRHRPKSFRLLDNPKLCSFVESSMDEGWSPQLISSVLARDYADDKRMQVSHETIYQCLYVQGRGQLRKDLYRSLSLKHPSRVARRPKGEEKRVRFSEALSISARPAEADDRAVPGHWEGDLLVGAGGKSAIGTLVERSTRFTILLHLPVDHTAEAVAAAMLAEMGQLPEHLRRSITWDRGSEIACHQKITLDLKAPVYLCDPHSPWQRGTNENTNRLLRFWFEKGTDLSGYSYEDLKRVQDTLNRRPRPTLGLMTPADKLKELLQTAA